MPSESEAGDAREPTSRAAPSTDDGRPSAGGDDPTAAGSRVDRDPIEWGPVRYDRLRSVGIGAAATVAAGVVALFGVAAVALITGAASGGISVPGVGETLVGAAFLTALTLAAAPSLYAWYRESSVGEWSRSGLRDRVVGLRPGWTAAGVAAVVVPLLVVPTDVLATLWPLLLVAVFAPTIARSAGETVRVDPAERVVERTVPERDRTRGDDLGAVVRTRRVDLPRTTVFLLAYRGNAWYRSTPWLFVPADRADAVESSLDAVLAESDGPDRASVPERLTLAVLGSFSLVVGLAMAAAGGEGTAGLALALLSAPASGLLIALAARL